jgi:hypothetical protein
VVPISAMRSKDPRVVLGRELAGARRRDDQDHACTMIQNMHGTIFAMSASSGHVPRGQLQFMRPILLTFGSPTTPRWWVMRKRLQLGPCLGHKPRTLPATRSRDRGYACPRGIEADGWVETRSSGSHRVLVKGSEQRIWAYHDGADLGGRPWPGSPAGRSLPARMNCSPGVFVCSLGAFGTGTGAA